MAVRDKDSGWAKLKRDLLRGGGKHVAVGFIDGGGSHSSGMSNAQLGATHEYGVPGKIPERSFLRRTFDAKIGDWTALAGELAKKIGLTMTAERALGLLGARAAADIKNTVTQGAGVPPPNAPSTIARKGSNRPLIDTGRLISAITWAVRGE